MSLFESNPLSHSAFAATDSQRPLADRMRPTTLDEYAGQEHILGPGKPLRAQIERDQLTSIILWGPPGVGKTTLAHIIARMTKSEFLPFSAVLAGIKEIKAVMADAERLRRLGRAVTSTLMAPSATRPRPGPTLQVMSNGQARTLPMARWRRGLSSQPRPPASGRLSGCSVPTARLLTFIRRMSAIRLVHP